MKSTFALAACLATTTALACDDHHGECEVEAWRSLEMFGSLSIEGVATCDSGIISIRLYGEDSQYLGNALGFIDGHAFSAIANNVKKPANLTIKYSIDAE
ncbi:MAG: hypothetical protein OXK82_08045 [Deltaproteobacteria bacterium]|nr:hypothetical protein [Deltaproteobacteria bacterium]